MRIVLDTNVLVSALLTPFGTSSRVLNTVLSGEVHLCVNEYILAEYREVLCRDRFPFDPSNVETLLAFCRREGLHIATIPMPIPLPDPDDEPFLEVASAGNVAALVTGNAKHFPMNACGDVLVLSPAEYIETFRE